MTRLSRPHSTSRRRLLPLFLAAALLALAAAPAPLPARGQSSPPTGALLADLAGGAVDGAAGWGDYDNDGDLDLLIGGTGAAGGRVTTFYRQRKGLLEPVAVGLPRVEWTSIDWGDYDNDGYLDLLLTGMQGFDANGIVGLAGVYRNIPDPAVPGQRAFQLAHALPPLYQGAGTWVDYDLDGRLDLLLSGYTAGGQPITRLYRGGPGGFSAVEAGFTALGDGGAAWGDADGDNFPDLALFGRDAGGVPRALVYRNTGGAGFSAPQPLTGVWGGSAVWFDPDGDGDLDLLLSGNRGDNTTNILPSTLLYRAEGGVLQPGESFGLPALWRSDSAAADYDGDGTADLLLNGVTASERITRVYLSKPGPAFQPAALDLPAASGLAVAWADFTGDRAPDLTLTGVPEGEDYRTRVLRNPNPPAPPLAAPQIEAACWDGAERITFYWQPAGAPGATYNLALADKTGATLLHPLADSAGGWRRVARPGNAAGGPSAVFQTFALGEPAKLVWAVQAVDAALNGGPFSETGRIAYGTPIAAPDAYSTPANTPLALDLLANDDHALGFLKLYSYTQPERGSLALAGGALSYTPPPFWAGTDRFTYQVVGAGSYCTAAQVTVAVTPPDTPVALSCAAGCAGSDPATKTIAVTMSEDGSPTPFALTLRGEDGGPGEPLAWTVLNGPAHGSVTLAPATLPGEDNPIRYSPAADWSGTDSFTTAVSDPYGSQDALTVLVTVLPVNDPPRIPALPDWTIHAGSGENHRDLGAITAGPPDEAAQPLAVTAFTGRPDLLPGLRVEPLPNGGWALTCRAPEITGTAQVTVRAEDGEPENGVTEQTFTVRVVNPALYLPLVTH